MNKPSKAQFRRKLPWIAGAGLALLIIIGFWPSALPVEAAAVTKGRLVVTVDEEGMTRVRNRYVVSAPVAGQLQRIDLKPGAAVAAGETRITTLETAGASLLDARGLAEARARAQGAAASRDVAEAQLERARSAAKNAQSDFERLQTLFKAGNISQHDFDASEMQRTTSMQDQRAAEFAVQVARFDVAQAEAALVPPTAGPAREILPITSPVSGKILRVLQESERVVVAGTPLLDVGDPTDLEARIEVLSRDGVAIAPGAHVTLEKWGGPEPLNARVRTVEPSAFTKISALGVEEQRVNVIVDITDPIERRPTLGDAYRVEARIVVWENADVIKVPSGSVFQRAGTWHAYVIDGGRARLRTIKVGRANGLETQVTDGLTAGEQVIVYPGDKIADGVRVTPAPVADR